MSFMGGPQRPAALAARTQDVDPGTPRDGDPVGAREEAGQTLRMFLQLALVGGPCLAIVALLHAPAIGFALIVVGVILLVMTFPAPGAVRWAGAALVIAPDQLIVTHLGGSPISLRTALFLVIGLITLLATVRRRVRFRVPSPLLLGILALAAVVGALNAGRGRSLLEFSVLIMLPPITGAVIASDRRLATEFLRGLTVGTLGLIVFAFLESVTHKNYLVPADTAVFFVRAGHLRTTAGWDYPTTLSAFLCLAGFFVVQTFRSRWGVLGMVVGGTLVAAALITTQARSGLLGFAAGAMVYLLLQRRASQGLGVLVGLGAIVGLLLALPGAAPQSFRNFVSESFTSGTAANANVHYRQELYSDAKAAMTQHPWVGYGYGAGKSVASNVLGTYFGDLTDLASLPVSLAVQVGLVGAGAAFLFLLLVAVRLARVRDVPGRLPLAAGIVGCFVAMLGVPVTPPFSWMLLLAGIGWSLTQRQRRPEERLAAARTSAGVGRWSPAHVPNGDQRPWDRANPS